tara:strand:+ start:948 stop:1214 length:267 start_codon:yes stop_codon:yes gene_type:complete
MESNKLIAEFMGLETSNGLVFQDANTKEFHSIKYHKDWNWLMPVVQKCLDVYHIELMNDDLNFEIYDSIGDIKNTYKAVVEFIKQYND